MLLAQKLGIAIVPDVTSSVRSHAKLHPSLKRFGYLRADLGIPKEFAANAIKNICCFPNSRHTAPRFPTSAHVKPYSCLSVFASLCFHCKSQDARVHRPRYPHRRFDNWPSPWNRFRASEAGGLVCAGEHGQAVATGDYREPGRRAYIDDGYSGKMLDRPALEDLHRDAKGDAYDAIYFHSAGRLARKVAHQNIVVDELLRCGKQIVIANKNYIHNPENQFTLTMFGAFAEFEREKIVERTTRGWRHRIRSGGLVSQGNRTFGYDFGDVSNFNRAFRRWYGETPSDVRSSARRNDS